MISEPTLNTIYRFLRPSGAGLLSKQDKLGYADSAAAEFVSINRREQDFFAAKLEELLPRERFIASGEELTEGYCWRYVPVNEKQCFISGIRRWSMLALGYLDKELHKFLIMEPSSGDYYWGRKDGWIFSRRKRIRVNRKAELENLALGIYSPNDPPSTKLGIGHIALCVSSGSPVLDLLDCAAGRLDIFYLGGDESVQTVDEDLARLIIKEAGGGIYEDGNNLVLANPYLIEAYQKLSC